MEEVGEICDYILLKAFVVNLGFCNPHLHGNSLGNANRFVIDYTEDSFDKIKV